MRSDKIMRILVVDDEPGWLNVLEQALKEWGHEVAKAKNGFVAVEKVKNEDFDLILTDFKMKGKDGLSVLKEVKTISPDTEIILMTAFASMNLGTEATQWGVYACIDKPFSMEKLYHFIKGVENKQQIKRDLKNAKKELRRMYGFDNIIGNSSKMHEVFKLIKHVVHSNTTVLILGESGTGKELLAKIIHYNSPRANKPFMAVHCAAMVETLLESELFGHEKGSFTGAHTRKLGRFELAKGGTIFLDEVGDIPLSIQVKLLRVLQDKRFYRVGGEEVIEVDVRVIAATNKNLEEAIRNGTFREDLYYRLNVFPIVLPPLRERVEDIPLLVYHFIEKLGYKGKKVTDEAMKCMQQYKWPGNIRELENVVERALLLSGRDPDDPITLSILPTHIREGDKHVSVIDIPDEGISLEELEHEYILKAIEKAKGNKSKAAKLLGITRRALYSRLKIFERKQQPQEEDVIEPTTR
jgi:DNA-binding NtrC family response regulator